MQKAPRECVTTIEKKFIKSFSFFHSLWKKCNGKQPQAYRDVEIFYPHLTFKHTYDTVWKRYNREKISRKYYVQLTGKCTGIKTNWFCSPFLFSCYITKMFLISPRWGSQVGAKIFPPLAFYPDYFIFSNWQALSQRKSARRQVVGSLIEKCGMSESEIHVCKENPDYWDLSSFSPCTHIIWKSIFSTLRLSLRICIQQEMQSWLSKTCLRISLSHLTLNTEKIQTNLMNSLLYTLPEIVPTLPRPHVVNCLNNTTAVTYILVFFHHSGNGLRQE